jgi:hypothetical protein
MPLSTTAEPEVKLFGRRYPWARWFRRGVFTLVKGRDYNGRSYTMAQQVRNAASRPGHRLKVSVQMALDENSLTVRVLGPLGGKKTRGEL